MKVWGKATAVLLLALLCWIGGDSRAASDAALQSNYDEVSRDVNRARGLALSILKSIKEIDKNHRFESGTVRSGHEGAARTRLARIESVKEAFEGQYRSAELGLKGIDKKLDKAAGSGVVDDLKRRAAEDRANLKKYHGYVDRFWKRSVKDFGEPLHSSAVGLSGAGGSGGVHITGEASFGLNTASYKQPNSSPPVDVSATAPTFGAKARWLVSERTNVLAHLRHEATANRTEISQTGFGASVRHGFSNQFAGTAGFDILSYKDGNGDTTGYGETSLFARADFSSGDKKFDAEIRSTSHSRDLAFGSAAAVGLADHSMLAMRLRATLPVGKGLMRLQLRRDSKSYKEGDGLSQMGADILSFTELSPSAVWQLTPGGSELGVVYRSYKYKEPTENPLNSTRLRAHFHAVSRNGTKTSRFGPEIYIYTLTDVPDSVFSGYMDFRLTKQTTSRGRRATSQRWDALYRLNSDSSRFDFAQIRFSRDSRPAGSGGYSKIRMIAQFYTETSAPTTDSIYDVNAGGTVAREIYAPPHVFDATWGFGWRFRGSSFIQLVSIGPKFNARFLVDQNGEKKTNKVGDNDYEAQHPDNAAEWGIEATLSGSTMTGVTWRVEGSYGSRVWYNADPVPTTSTFSLATNVGYPINDRWRVDGHMRIRNTSQDLDDSKNLDKTDVGVFARYLFDFTR